MALEAMRTGLASSVFVQNLGRTVLPSLSGFLLCGVVIGASRPAASACDPLPALCCKLHWPMWAGWPRIGSSIDSAGLAFPSIRWTWDCCPSQQFRTLGDSQTKSRSSMAQNGSVDGQLLVALVVDLATGLSRPGAASVHTVCHEFRLPSLSRKFGA
jgi:hypothetical protein